MDLIAPFSGNNNTEWFGVDFQNPNQEKPLHVDSGGHGLILLDAQQGSKEWLDARIGKPTGSQFSRIVDKDGHLVDKRHTYMAELIEEYILFNLGEEFKELKTPAILRGKRLEPIARNAYAFGQSFDVVEVGGVYKNEDRDVLVSPDGLVIEERKGVEFKCPSIKTHFLTTKHKIVPHEHLMQCYAGMWATGFERWDYVSYCPEYKPQPILEIPVICDYRVMEALNASVLEFAACTKLEKERYDNS